MDKNKRMALIMAIYSVIVVVVLVVSIQAVVNQDVEISDLKEVINKMLPEGRNDTVTILYNESMFYIRHEQPSNSFLVSITEREVRNIE